jgi:hypothetical protein
VAARKLIRGEGMMAEVQNPFQKTMPQPELQKAFRNVNKIYWLKSPTAENTFKHPHFIEPETPKSHAMNTRSNICECHWN